VQTESSSTLATIVAEIAAVIGDYSMVTISGDYFSAIIVAVFGSRQCGQGFRLISHKTKFFSVIL